MDERRLRDDLRRVPLADEDGARDRGWRVVQAAFAEREAAPRSGRAGVRLAIAAAGAAAVLAIVLTPAGAKVADVFRDVTGIGSHNASPALTSLPAPGRLLVDSSEGPWVVSNDGSNRLLGDYASATWSPHGLFVATTRSHELAAVDSTNGIVHWTLTPSRSRPVSDPAWSESGFRIAYRSGNDLRVVDGDGTGDRLLVRHVASTAPAWRPLSPTDRQMAEKGVEPPEQLAYADRAGRVRVVDPASGRTIWSSAQGPKRPQLLWSGDGRRLIIATRRRVEVRAGDGKLLRLMRFGRRMRITTAAASDASLALAVRSARRSAAPRSRVRLLPLRATSTRSPTLASGPGSFTSLAFSPNGRWLLAAWRDANQWLFIPLSGGKVKAVGHISQQFAPGSPGEGSFPSVEGWCCG